LLFVAGCAYLFLIVNRQNRRTTPLLSSQSKKRSSEPHNQPSATVIV
jgi:hypothetical protein